MKFYWFVQCESLTGDTGWNTGYLTTFELIKFLMFMKRDEKIVIRRIFPDKSK